MRVLAIGVATLDIINRVSSFPVEDDEIRAQAHEVRRGGNAANTLVVLSQLGYRCSWGGTLADDLDKQVILDDLARYQIDSRACRCYRQGKNPTSYVILSQATGSRTIVHYRDIPEYQANDFLSINLAEFDWIHFEGRNVHETLKMLQSIKRSNPHRPISLEMEKPREDLESLLPWPDVLLFSKVYAESHGHRDPTGLFAAVRPSNPQAILVCAWGDKGAWLLQPEGSMIHAPAYHPEQIIDTLGAGDVFNAAIIDGLLQGRAAAVALDDAVHLAGIKCGRRGLDGLAGQ